MKQDQFYYRVYIRTDSDKLYNKEGKAFGITPGMVATVDIRTGQKQYSITYLNHLIKPKKRYEKDNKKPRDSGLFIGLILLNSRYNLIFIMLYLIYGFYDCITDYI